jgi:hypothetical protein
MLERPSETMNGDKTPDWRFKQDFTLRPSGDKVEQIIQQMGRSRRPRV